MNRPEIIFVPEVLNPVDRKPTDSFTVIMTLEEVLETYGDILTPKEIQNLFRVAEQSSPKHQEYLKRIEDEVDKQLMEMLEELNITK